MSILLPILGLVLAALAAFLTKDADRSAARSPAQAAIVGGAVVLFATFGIWRFAPDVDRMWLLGGVVLGVLAAVLTALQGAKFAVGAAWGIAFAVCCQAIPPESRPSAQIALLAAAGIGGALMGVPSVGVAAAGVVATDSLGRLAGGSETLPYAGSVLGVVAILGILVSHPGSDKGATWRLIACAVPIVVGFAMASMWLGDSALGGMIALGGVSGLVIHFLLPESDDPSALGAGLAAVITVSLATVAFALGRGTAMAHALLAGVAVVCILRNPRALAALGPLLGLVLFRIFRSEHPETSRAFDIGQHYAILGLLLGMILPLVFADWQAGLRASTKTAAASGLWALLVLGATPVLMVFMGAHGTVGMIVGFGISGLVTALRGRALPVALSLGSGMAGLVLGAYGWLGTSIDLTRDEKVVILAWAGGAVLVIAAAIAFLSGRLSTVGAMNESA